MKLNRETKIIGLKTILVPYRRSHVQKYHMWMESEELRQQTASIKLSLTEEYSMQQSWLNDEKKCTFIVLDKATANETENEEESMVGDVNLYVKEEDDTSIGEIALMIADSKFRGSGRGKEAALHMLRYGVECIGLKKFLAVISLDNEKSINMFLKLMFEKESESTVFQEMTLSRYVTEEWLHWLLKNTSNYQVTTTEPNE